MKTLAIVYFGTTDETRIYFKRLLDIQNKYKIRGCNYLGLLPKIDSHNFNNLCSPKYISGTSFCPSRSISKII